MTLQSARKKFILLRIDPEVPVVTPHEQILFTSPVLGFLIRENAINFNQPTRETGSSCMSAFNLNIYLQPELCNTWVDSRSRWRLTLQKCHWALKINMQTNCQTALTCCWKIVSLASGCLLLQRRLLKVVRGFVCECIMCVHTHMHKHASSHLYEYQREMSE